MGHGEESCFPVSPLTIHSSRTRFVASFKRVVVPLQQLTDSCVAGRLNSSVRPLGAVQRFGGSFVVVARSLRLVFGSSRWFDRRTSGSSRAVASGLRFGVRVPTSRRRDCSSVVGSSGRRSGSRGAANASCRTWLSSVTGGLTIHSSRTRFVASFKCVVVPLHQLSDQQVAGRLNSSVRPHKAVQRFGGVGVDLAPQLRRIFGSSRWLGRRASWGFRAVASRLRFVIPMGEDCGGVTVLIESSSRRRSGCRGAARASHQAPLPSARTAA